LIFLAAFNDEVKGFFSNAFLMRLAKTGIVAVVILIVSVPEGLPVAVSIAMAMSTEALKKDHILIKKLESIQTCAMLHDICVGKTGTLTTSEITVSSY
jgi:P-type E1-E2 ATPase